MLIKELINKYLELGYSFNNAQNLAAQEIVITKIATSSLSEHVTLKGGIVMYNLSKNDRRVTQDLDFDFIRYSINEESIYFFVDKLNSTNDQIHCRILGKPEKLHHEEYKGVRVNLLLIDAKKGKAKIKLDIGVHSHLSIEQEQVVFSFESGNKSVQIKANAPEQIFTEKLISLVRLGVISTRYKDIYDMYYFIINDLVDKSKLCNLINLLLNKKSKKRYNNDEIIKRIIDVLNNIVFQEEASKPLYKWIDEDFEKIKCKLIGFICSIFCKNKY